MLDKEELKDTITAFLVGKVDEWVDEAYGAVQALFLAVNNAAEKPAEVPACRSELLPAVVEPTLELPEGWCGAHGEIEKECEPHV